MANLTAKYAKWVHGKNPQFLIEEVIRWRIYETRYWMEECFALSAAQLVDKAIELKYVGGTVAPATRPTPFLCLAAKMLQIQPSMDIVEEFIRQEDFKYMRCLGMFYFRLVADTIPIYEKLEPYYNDFRKIKYQQPDGKMVLLHIDEFVDKLLHADRWCSIQLPRIQMRKILEAEDKLEPYISPLADEFDEMLAEEEDQSSEMEASDSDLEAQYDLTLKLPRKEKKKKEAVGDYVSSEDEMEKKWKEKEKEVTNLGDLINNYAKDKDEMKERAKQKQRQLLAAEDNEALLNRLYNRKDTSEEERELEEQRKAEKERKRKKKELKMLERQKAEKTRKRSESPIKSRIRDDSPGDHRKSRRDERKHHRDYSHNHKKEHSRRYHSDSDSDDRQRHRKRSDERVDSSSRREYRDRDRKDRDRRDRRDSRDRDRKRR